MSHECKHEVDLALIRTHSENTAKDVAEIKKCLLIGNGVPAMTTRIAKIEQIVNGGLWLAGAIVLSVIGLLFDLARRMI
jgi:hypothetical protein